MTEQERKAPLDMKDITVDVGAVSKEEAVEKFGIRIGEPVVPDVTFTYSETTDLMVGKSFDCRLGCAAILKTMHTLAGQELNVDIVGACAAQEEVGVRGATVTAQVIKPDIAIVFEGCPADDTFTPDYFIQTAMKKGPMLRHFDRSMVTNHVSRDSLWSLAENWASRFRNRFVPAAAPMVVQSTPPTAVFRSSSSVFRFVTSILITVLPLWKTTRTAVKLAVEIIKRLNDEKIKSF